jgi:glycosyltransferase involved in cell wall biosynthesis
MPARGTDVTVVIPAFRAATTIRRCLRGIAGQTVTPGAVIVVDDGSDDGTAEVAEACREMLGGIALTVVRQDNVGPGAARNHALHKASSAYVAFLDADDEWLADKIDVSLAAIRGTPFAFVAHNLFLVRNGDVAELDCARHFVGAHDPYTALFRRGFVATSTVVARRDAVLAAGGFDPSLPAGQDYDLWLRLCGPGEESFVVLADALARCHVTPGSVTSHVAQRRRCALRILNRHLPFLRARGKFAFGVAMARTLIIGYEAAAAYRASRRWFAVAGTVIRTPADLVATAVRYIFRVSGDGARRSSLAFPSDLRGPPPQ